MPSPTAPEMADSSSTNGGPGFFVGISQDSLLAEIDASLGSTFAELQQRALDKVRELLEGASLQQEATGQQGQHVAVFASKSMGASPLRVMKQQSHEERDAKGYRNPRDTLPTAGQADETEQPNHVPDAPKSPDFEVKRFTTAAPSRANSFGSESGLRAELQRGESNADAIRGSTSFKKVLNAWFPCSCTLGGSIEPKDLNFDQIAARRGKRWNECSLNEQVGMIRDELTRTSLTIDPQSDPMKFWDVIVICCLVFTALVLPYEVAFLEAEYGLLYSINHGIDVIFLFDMIMQFFLKVRVTKRRQTRWVRKRSHIAKTYLKTWFPVDVLSIIPYDDISNLASKDQDSDLDLQHLKVMRLLRVLRLLKLFRMLRASRVAKRWENRNSLQSSTKHLAKCFLLIIVSAHWMACIWGFFGVWEGSNLKCRRDLEDNHELVLATPAASWYVDVDEYAASNNPSAWKGQSWVIAFALNRAATYPFDPCSHSSLYIVSIYWAIMTMTSIGYGDILPQVVSEYVVCCLCMIFSGILWAYVIGIASSILCNMFPEKIELEQRLDAFNAMVVDMQAPSNIRQRGREYLRESRYKWSHERNMSVIQSLGFDLQANLSKQSAKRYFGTIPLFTRCSQLFCADCAASMEPHFFEPHYVVQLNNHLAVVEKGAVGHAGRVLVPWNSWGQDFIVKNTQLRIHPRAVALNYALVVSLSRGKLEHVLVEHPQERWIFGRAAVCMAFLGAMRLYFRDLKTMEFSSGNYWIHEVMDSRFTAKWSSRASLQLRLTGFEDVEV